MKALMLHSENSGVGYYRIWQQAKYLKRLGWDIAITPDHNPVLPNDDAIGRATKDKELKANFKKYGSWESLGKGSDILVYQRPDDPQTLAMALAMRDVFQAPLVFEIDDNIFDVAESSPSYKYWYPGSPYRDLAVMFLQSVDAITTTTQNLADVYSQYNKNIYVLPNCQDPEDWKGIKKPKNEDKLVIGWAGSVTHYDDLRMVRRAILKFLRFHPQAVLRIMGTLPDFFSGNAQIEMRKDIVGIRDWPKKLAELNFDIGIAPVVDRPFNQGKSNIKWQEYSMLKVPTIASKVGGYREIEHGVTGLLATDEITWYYNLCKLAEDARLRQDIGRKANKYILDNHNIAVNIDQWNKVYKKIITGHTQVDSDISTKK